MCLLVARGGDRGSFWGRAVRARSVQRIVGWGLARRAIGHEPVFGAAGQGRRRAPPMFSWSTPTTVQR